MSDYRELLELAAKAAGHEVRGPAQDFVSFLDIDSPALVIANERGGDSVWNPRDFDGDAFRLAGALDMSVEFSEENGCCEASTENFGANEHCINYGGDIMAAARMAILIAAAERRKAMP